MLAAVVKGTQFTVTIDNGRTKVDVESGMVEVADEKNDISANVMPGQSAVSNEAGAFQVSGPNSGATIYIVGGVPVPANHLQQATGFSFTLPTLSITAAQSLTSESSPAVSNPSDAVTTLPAAIVQPPNVQPPPVQPPVVPQPVTPPATPPTTPPTTPPVAPPTAPPVTPPPPDAPPPPAPGVPPVTPPTTPPVAPPTAPPVTPPTIPDDDDGNNGHGNNPGGVDPSNPGGGGENGNNDNEDEDEDED